MVCIIHKLISDHYRVLFILNGVRICQEVRNLLYFVTFIENLTFSSRSVSGISNAVSPPPNIALGDNSSVATSSTTSSKVDRVSRSDKNPYQLLFKDAERKVTWYCKKVFGKN